MDTNEDYLKVKKMVNSSTINNYYFENEVILEKYRLSNYKNCLNDYLVIGSIHED